MIRHRNTLVDLSLASPADVSVIPSSWIAKSVDETADISGISKEAHAILGLALEMDKALGWFLLPDGPIPTNSNLLSGFAEDVDHFVAMLTSHRIFGFYDIQVTSPRLLRTVGVTPDQEPVAVAEYHGKTFAASRVPSLT